jgi:GTP pyrophosphokinase
VATKKIAAKELGELHFVGNKLILPKEEKHEPKQPTVEDTIKSTLKKNAELLIFGENLDKIDYKFANCCNPIPGDDVFGFVTISDGIKIHKTNCPNAVQLMSNYGYRIIKTKWSKDHAIAFLTELKLSGLDDVGVMNKITNIISSELKINMRSISIESKDGIFEGVITVFVQDTDQLDNLIKRLKGLDGILSISRQ